MGYFSLVLSNFSRILLRRNSTISYLNIFLLLIVLGLWVVLGWGFRTFYSGPLIIQVTLLVQFLTVVGLIGFSRHASRWQNYFSIQTLGWLRVSPAVLVGSFYALITLLPYYLAYTDSSSWQLICLRLLVITILSFAVSFLGSALGLLLKKIISTELMRFVFYSVIIIAVFSVISTEPFLLTHAVIAGTSINALLLLLVGVIGLLGFSFGVFEWGASQKELTTPESKYSGLLRSFHVFGTSNDQFSLQLTNSLLRWVRNSQINHRLLVMLVINFVIGQLFVAMEMLDLKSVLIMIGVISASLTAVISYTAVTEARAHTYQWLPLSHRSAVVSNWLSGVLVYLCVIVIMTWLLGIFDNWTALIITATVLTVHTMTMLVTYRLNDEHIQQSDRILPIVLGAAIFGVIPGIYFEVVSNSTALSILGGWLLVAIIWLNLVTRNSSLSKNA